MIDLLASAAALLVLDQWSKRMIEVHVGDRRIAFGRGAQIRLVLSRKGLYASDRARMLLVLVWLAAFASALLLQDQGFQSRAARIGLGGALGGAAGNLLDILRSKSVADFIDLGWWPVFNLADAAIIGGLVLALLSRS